MDQETREELARFREAARSRLHRAALTVVALGVLSALYSIWGEAFHAWLRGETDLLGNPVYDPPYPVDEASLAQIDMREVHAHLIPGWVIASSKARRAGGHSYADRAYGELREAIRPDRNLSALFEELDRHLRTDPIGEARRIDYLLWAYNDYLDHHDLPWRVEATLYLRGRRALFYTSSYEIAADLSNARGHRVRLLHRADLTNVVEGYLGHTARPEEGALIVLDRVLHFAVRHVWPLMHPALDDRRPPRESSMGRAVRLEARQALSPALFSLLTETAVDQQALIEVADSIHARRACGNRFRVWGLPYKGLSPMDQTSLVAALLRSDDKVDCPEVTLEEAARMVGASERLGNAARIDPAIEELALWVTKSVAAHELCHVMDGNPEELTCQGCPRHLSPAARAELSAYLAAFATPGVGYAALLQACTQSRSGDGPHEAALSYAFLHLVPGGCVDGPPEDLYRRARALETQLFGPREPVLLPEPFPQRLPLMRRR